jgi:hypothetical protein
MIRRQINNTVATAPSVVATADATVVTVVTVVIVVIVVITYNTHSIELRMNNC